MRTPGFKRQISRLPSASGALTRQGASGRGSIKILKLALSVMVCLFLGCRSGSPEEAAKSQGGKVAAETGSPPAPRDDESFIVEATPMGLLDPKDLLAFSSQASRNSAGQTFQETAASNGSSRRADQAQLSDAQFAQAVAIVSAPGVAAHEMKLLLDGLAALFTSIFGVDGFFGAKDVPVKIAVGKTTGARSFRVPSDPTYAFLELSVDVAAEPHAYAVDLFAASGERLVHIDFSRGVGAVGAKIRVISVSPKSQGPQTYLDAAYEAPGTGGSARHLRAAFGPIPTSESVPAKTLLDLSFDEAGASSLAGAYSWHRAAASLPTDVLLPARYKRIGDLDIEIFRVLTKPSAEPTTFLTAQELAFLPRELTSQAFDFAQGRTLFSNFGYPTDLSRFIVDVIRREDVNRDCATTGRQIREAFGDADGTPLAVKSAPDDLCRTQTSVADATVADLVAAVCATKADIALPVETAAGEAIDFRICRSYLEIGILTNPQYIVTQVETSKRTLLDPAKKKILDESTVGGALPAGSEGLTPYVTLPAIAKELDQSAFPDFAAVLDQMWTPLVAVAPERFSAAETKP